MSKPSTHSSQKNKYVFLSLILLLVVLSFVTYQLYTKNQQVLALQQAEQQRKDEETIKLPANAVKISGCLPYMGEHWVVPSTIPFGPFYVTYNNKVTAIEYMFKPEEIPGELLAKASPDFAFKYMTQHNLTLADLTRPAFTFNTSGLKYKFAELSWTQPHAGFITPHYDLHFFFIDRNEVNTICPNATFQEAQSPEIERALQKYNIPYIPLPKQ